MINLSLILKLILLSDTYYYPEIHKKTRLIINTLTRSIFNSISVQTKKARIIAESFYIFSANYT